MTRLPLAFLAFPMLYLAAPFAADPLYVQDQLTNGQDHRIYEFSVTSLGSANKPAAQREGEIATASSSMATCVSVIWPPAKIWERVG